MWRKLNIYKLKSQPRVCYKYHKRVVTEEYSSECNSRTYGQQARKSVCIEMIKEFMPIGCNKEQKAVRVKNEQS